MPTILGKASHFLQIKDALWPRGTPWHACGTGRSANDEAGPKVLLNITFGHLLIFDSKSYLKRLNHDPVIHLSKGVPFTRDFLPEIAKLLEFARFGNF